MMEDIDDPPNSEETYRVSTYNVSTKHGLFSSPSTLGFFCYWNAGRTIQNVAMARILDRPSFGVSCW